MWCKNVCTSYLFCHNARFWETDEQTDRRRERHWKYRALHCMQSHGINRNIGWFCWRFLSEVGRVDLQWDVHLPTDLPVDWLIYLSTDLYTITAATASMKHAVAPAVAMATSLLISRGSLVDSIRSAEHQADVSVCICPSCSFIWYSLISSTASIYANGRYGRMHTCM